MLSVLSEERRDRVRWAALTVLGTVMLAAAAVVQSRADDVSFVSVGCGIAGGLALFMGFPNGLVAHHYVTRAQALRRGRNVIARWTVTRAAWERVVQSDAGVRNDGQLWPNQLKLRPCVEPGVEVIVGEDAILAGDCILLVRQPWPERLEVMPGNPVGLNLVANHDGPDGPETEVSYRLPVGAGMGADVALIRSRLPDRTALEKRRQT